MMGFYTIIRLTSGFALSALLLSSSGVALASDASASALAVQARAQLDAGNVTRAELLYAQAMQEAPGDVGLSMTLAEIYIAQRRFDEADRLIATTLLVQPSDSVSGKRADNCSARRVMRQGRSVITKKRSRWAAGKTCMYCRICSSITRRRKMMGAKSKWKITFNR